VGCKFFLDLPVGVHSHLSLALIVAKLHLVLLIQAGAGHPGPLLLVLRPHGAIYPFLLFKYLLHLIDHLDVVLADRGYALDHGLKIAVASLLLEVFNLLPEVLGYLGRGSGRMNGLGEPVLGEEFLDFGLLLLLGLELTVDDLLEFLLDLYLHSTDLGRDNVAKLVLNGKLALKVLHDGL